jgi:hypothetical protein
MKALTTVLLLTIALQWGTYLVPQIPWQTRGYLSLLFYIFFTVYKIINEFFRIPRPSEAVLTLEERRLHPLGIPILVICVLFIIWSITNPTSTYPSWYYTLFWSCLLLSSIFTLYMPPVFLTDKGISMRGNFTPWHKIKSYTYFDWNEIEFMWAKPTLFGVKSFRLRPYPHKLVSGNQINAVLSKHLPRTEVSELETVQQTS